MGDSRDRLPEDLFAGFVELVPEVDVRRGDEGVDPRRGRLGHRFPGPVNIGRIGPRKRRDSASPDLPGDLADGGKIPLRGDREPGFDDVDPQLFELAGDPDFLVRIHACPR